MAGCFSCQGGRPMGVWKRLANFAGSAQREPFFCAFHTFHMSFFREVFFISAFDESCDHIVWQAEPPMTARDVSDAKGKSKGLQDCQAWEFQD